MTDKNQEAAIKNTPETDTDQERREALKKIGRFGTYTAPAMLAMLSSKASAVPMSMIDV
ncbi:MAG: hypothetical protein ABW162_04035 [Candidatus Sedimenticola sp. PURPLELP]